MKKIKAILSKSYPLEEQKPAQLKLAFIFGMVVFLLLFLLKPFGNQVDSHTLLVNCIVAGLLTFSTIVFDFFVFFPLFPKFFREEQWNIGREVIFTLLIITSIATANILAGSIFWGSTLSFTNWLRMIFYTAFIGIAPATLSILINQARLLKKYRMEVQSINKQLQHPLAIDTSLKTAAVAAEVPKVSSPNEITEANETIAVAMPSTSIANVPQITIEAENEKDNLRIEVSSFIAACSADNYVKVFYQQNEQLKTVMVRTTLKKLEENALAFPDFFRCHRTAIINIAAVQKLSGSAQGYRLQLQYLPEEIPVSRNLNPIIKQKLATVHP